MINFMNMNSENFASFNYSLKLFSLALLAMYSKATSTPIFANFSNEVITRQNFFIWKKKKKTLRAISTAPEHINVTV